MIYSIHVCYSVSTNALASSCCTSLTVQSSHPNRTPVDMHMPISRPSLRMFFTLERKKVLHKCSHKITAYLLPKSLACKFLVILGSFTTKPSSSLLIHT
jgi:hypothetical protein